MDIIYEVIFLGLIDTSQNSKISRPLRVFAAILISIIFLTSIITLGLYVVLAVEEGIFKRLISAVLLVVIAGYYVHLLKAMTKTKKINKANDGLKNGE